MQEKLYPGVKTFMIEASPSHREQLDAVKNTFKNVVDYEIAVLSHSDGETIEFYAKEGLATGNSMFLEQTEHFNGVKPELRTTSKLDTVVGHMEHVDYIKIDVQGAELAVLSGATETLKKLLLFNLKLV